MATNIGDILLLDTEDQLKAKAIRGASKIIWKTIFPLVF